MKSFHAICATIGSSWGLLLLVAVMQLVQIPIALRFLGQREFALFAVISQLMGVVTLLDLGMTSSFSRHLIDGHVAGGLRYRQVWAAGVLIIAVQSVIMAIVATALMPLIPGWFRLGLDLAPLARDLFWALGGVLALRHLLSIYGIALFAGQQLAASNLAQMAGSVVQFGVFLWLLALGCGLWSYVGSLFLGVLASSTLQWRACRVRGLSAPLSWRELRRDDVTATVSFGFDAFVLMLFELLINGLILAFAGRLVPLEQVAVFAVNLKPVQLLAQIIHRIQASCEPVLASLASGGELDRFRFGWLFLVKGVMGASVACAVAYAIWCPGIITLWTSSAMILPALGVFLLVLTLIRHAAHRLLVNSLYLFKRINVVRGWLFLEAALYVVLGAGLGSRYGVVGILMAVLLSMLAGTAFVGGRHMVRFARIPGPQWGSAVLRVGCFAFVNLVVLGSTLRTLWSLTLPARCILTAGWMMAAAIVFAAFVLDAHERRQVMRHAVRHQGQSP
jgi:O-antigen/teichoic acid export membrane protein